MMMKSMIMMKPELRSMIVMKEEVQEAKEVFQEEAEEQEFASSGFLVSLELNQKHNC